MLVDFFCFMEDVFGIDFDWFWRGWFYLIDYVDIVIEGVCQFNVSMLDLDVEKGICCEEREVELEIVFE